MLQINKNYLLPSDCRSYARYLFYYLLILLFFIEFSPECHALKQPVNKNILISDKSDSQQNNQPIDANNSDTSHGHKPPKSGLNLIQKIISFIKDYPPVIIYIIAFLIPIVVYLQRRNKS